MSNKFSKKKILALLLLCFIALSFLIKLVFLSNRIDESSFVDAPIIKIVGQTPGYLNLSQDIDIGYNINNNNNIGKININNGIDTNIINIKAQIYTLKNTLTINEIDLKNQENRLIFVRKKLNEYKNIYKYQQFFDSLNLKNQIEIAKANLKKQSLSLEKSSLDQKRAVELINFGAYSKNALLDYDIKLNIDKNQYIMNGIELKQANLEKDGITRNVQTSANRNLSEAYNIYIAYASEEDAIQNTVLSLNEKIKLNTDQLKSLETDQAKYSASQIVSTISGVVWNMYHHTGDYLTQYSPVLDIIDCNKLYIDSFVSANSAKKININQEVVVKARDQELKGSVQTIRFATGRFSPGSDIASPPAELLRRELPVRLATVRIKLKNTEDFKNYAFCGVGQEVEIYLK